MQVTVSIVNYKTPKDTILLVQQIQKFHPDFEIILSDNSPEDSGDIFSKEFPYITIINNPNIGFGSAHNQAIKLAQGLYIAIINPDVLINSSTFTKLINFMDKHKDVSIAGPKLVSYSGKIQASAFQHPSFGVQFLIRRTPLKYVLSNILIRYTLSDRVLSKSQQVPWISGAFMMIRGKHYFDEKFFLYAEDADLCRTVGNVWYVPQATASHRANYASRRSFKLLFTHASSLLYYWKKHWGK